MAATSLKVIGSKTRLAVHAQFQRGRQQADRSTLRRN
jgi:hypothetical protein